MTYYFDSVSGNDTNPTNSISTPWKSLSKVTSLTLAAGDSVLFKCGGTWLPWDSGVGKTGGTLTIGESGSSGNPITFGSYGTGSNPVISGFYPVPTTGWTQVGSTNVWTLTDTTHFPTTMINTLLYNSAIKPVGRFPTSGYLTYTSFVGTTQINFAAGSLNANFQNGQVVIRKGHFHLSGGTITSTTSSASTSLTYTAAGTATLTNNYGFFVQNHQNCLTQPGDWCYDPTSQTLSMWFTSGPTGTIAISVTDSLVVYTGAKDYNTFTNIDFTGGNNYGINVAGATTGTQVLNCNFSNIGIRAILLSSANTCTISGNTFTDSVNNAIYLTAAVNNSILSNTVTRTGQIAGMGQPSDSSSTGFGAYCGIAVAGTTSASGNKVIGNTVKSSGYNGLFINGDTYIIDNNLVDTACTVLDDGGCIYTNVSLTTPHTYVGRTISNNTVLNSIGAPAGTDGSNQGAGIYADDNSSNLTINNNTAYNCGQYGFFLHNSHEMAFVDNLAYNNAIAQLAIIENDTATNNPKPINFTVCNNVLLANSATQLCFLFHANNSHNSALGDFANIGICNHNTYGSLFTNANLFSTLLYGGSVTVRDFASWKSYTSLDADSTTQFKLTIPPVMALS